MDSQTDPAETTGQQRYKRAKERVDALRSFYIHLLTYLLVNTSLFVLNLLTRGRNGNWWFYWPLFGWGIGLASHAITVFGIFGLFGHGWEERKIREMMEKDERNTPGA